MKNCIRKPISENYLCNVICLVTVTLECSTIFIKIIDSIVPLEITSPA